MLRVWVVIDVLMEWQQQQSTNTVVALCLLAVQGGEHTVVTQWDTKNNNKNTFLLGGAGYE